MLYYLAGLLLLAAAPAAQPRLTAIQPISLHAGVNRVPGFMPDGSAVMIVQAWRDNGNAHGYHVWLVLSPTSEGSQMGVVLLEEGEQARDLIRDEPFDGERVLGAVRFARGKIDGQPASLLLKADLDPSPSGVAADHASATLRLFRLVTTDDAPGDAPYEFRQVAVRRTIKHYCNAELALAEGFGIPLAADYAGPNRVDGCYGRPDRQP